MRSKILFLLLSFFPSVFAADVHIKVVDPRAAAVSGAQVSLYRQNEKTPLQVRTTSGDGEAVFAVDQDSGLRVQVLAAGFAAAWAEVVKSPLVVMLRVAAPSETVVVTATRTPVAEEETGTNVSLLSSEEIETMQPTSFADALRFLPGAVVNVAGQRGGLGSLFVEGGDSRYNKVLVDGVPINDPGGTFDFSTLPLTDADRIEFLQGAQSTLYGSDAMTSVTEVFSRSGTTETPELRFGADGGTFGTAHGYMALSGVRSRFDYDAFADQFNTNGQGPNADYTNALQGGNLGVQLSDRVLFRVRARHSNSRTGVPGEWDFNGQRLLAPDADQFARANDFVSSAEFLISGPSAWQHRVTGYEYNTRRLNQDVNSERGCPDAQGFYIDCPFTNNTHLNRAGFMYQGDYTPRTWLQTTVGYEFEDGNGRLTYATTQPAPRLNHAVYFVQRVTWKRLSAVTGARYVHNSTFGSNVAPRVSLALLALKGGSVLSGTRLRFSFDTGIKESRFEEEYAGPPYSIPNLGLKPEENRAFETGFDQKLWNGRYQFSGAYFDNLFRNQIDYVTVDPVTFVGQYQNINKSMAHGAEARFTGHVTSHVSLMSAYVYTSSQILVQPAAFDTLHQPGQPLLRRPKHSGNVLLNYLGSRWGANLGGSFVGRRSDSDFLGFGIKHAAGDARVDLGGWYAVNSHVTAYANVENGLNSHYNEVVGYPALSANVRAGLRFRIGGE